MDITASEKLLVAMAWVVIVVLWFYMALALTLRLIIYAASKDPEILEKLKESAPGVKCSKIKKAAVEIADHLVPLITPIPIVIYQGLFATTIAVGTSVVWLVVLYISTKPAMKQFKELTLTKS